jgi:hypothetical protein
MKTSLFRRERERGRRERDFLSMCLFEQLKLLYMEERYKPFFVVLNSFCISTG